MGENDHPDDLDRKEDIPPLPPVDQSRAQRQFGIVLSAREILIVAVSFVIIVILLFMVFQSGDVEPEMASPEQQTLDAITLDLATVTAAVAQTQTADALLPTWTPTIDPAMVTLQAEGTQLAMQNTQLAQEQANLRVPQATATMPPTLPAPTARPPTARPPTAQNTERGLIGTCSRNGNEINVGSD